MTTLLKILPMALTKLLPLNHYVSFLELPYKSTTNEVTERTAVYSFTVLEARSSKSTCWQACAPSETLGKNHPLPLPASDGYWPSLGLLGFYQLHSNLCLYLHMVFFPSVCWCPNFPLCIRMPVL